MTKRWTVGVGLAMLLVASRPSCVRPAEERAERDLEVGHTHAGGVGFDVSAGLAAVRRAEPGELTLWASAPVFSLDLTASDDAERSWTIEIRNCLPDADLVVKSGAGAQLSPVDIGLSTTKRWLLDLEPGSRPTLELNVPDAADRGPWRFAVLSDIQEAIDRVQDIFVKVNQSNVRFLLGAGDLTQQGTLGQLTRFQDEMHGLEVPYYTTLGNHELGQNPPIYHDLFGRGSFHFAFRGVKFSMLDSGSATLDPMVYDWLDGWLASSRDDVHVVAMHVPPLDPIGVRNGAFASRGEAAKLLTRLAKGHVDLTLYGHIHSYYSFDNAGIPAYISGGGGAIPEKFDGIGRHFLVVEVSADGGVKNVETVRVDEGD